MDANGEVVDHSGKNTCLNPKSPTQATPPPLRFSPSSTSSLRPSKPALTIDWIVVMNGHYWCSGFYPGGFEGGDGKKISSWMPFTPIFMGTTEAEDVNGSKREIFVEI
ncbi:hypothetical protein U1Q18_036975 [Sarracenia purpurea var. burkii]